MCGIAGRINREAPVDREELFRMTESLAHRGPDDHGYHLRARVGLGHRRLSIVDLATGHQPLSNEDGTVWIVFNGEIYNHDDLRRELRARGHVFKTRSDTEAIVHAYEEWGAECVTRLRGMFAFAIWDDRAQSLTLVRDRLGIKPVYYAHLPSGDLVFASEAKALLEVEEVDPSIDDEALAAYLALRYVPGPLTLFRGIKKLPPGTTLRWHRGLTSLRTYWDLGLLPIDDVRPTEAEAAHELARLVDEATRLRLMSEVPIGAFLSGGLDSTVVTEAMLRARGRDAAPLRTFSVGYHGDGTRAEDELAMARAAATALGTEHVEARVRVEEARDVLPDLVWHLDEPVADPACVPLWFLSRLTKKSGVTVVLSGEGADEILAGYAIYARQSGVERLRQSLLGARVASLGAGLLALVGPRVRTARLAARIELAAQLLGAPLERRYRGVSRGLTDATRARLLGTLRADAGTPPCAALLDGHFEATRGMSPLRRMLHLDTRVWLPDDLLVKADKMTMAHAVELRVPLLDHELVRYCWSLPDDMKLRGGVGKWLLRRAARHRIPASVIRRKKMGFATPTSSWLRGGLYDLMNDALFGVSSLARARFDLPTVRRLVLDHAAGADHAADLWPLLVLELWHERVRARRPLAPPTPRLDDQDRLGESVHVAS
jgi:asparagine synthase (glutamine-hydrolysing)